MSGLVIVFLLFDGAVKLVPIAPVTETMEQLGYPVSATLRAVSVSLRLSAPCSIWFRKRPFWARSC